MSGRYVISAFYKFVELIDHPEVRDRILGAALDFGMVGSILVAPEGINATVAGERGPTDAFMTWLRTDARFADLTAKESYADVAPFKRMKVRRKREIVTFHQPVDPTRTVGTYVDPSNWDDLIADPSVLVIDTRNDEEVQLGTFKHAVNPGTRSFTEFADFVAGLDPDVHPRVAMFCTGGIRCEKASSYLLEQGFPEVFHLEGGILNYLEAVPAGHGLWQGECFVFDDRVTVDHELRPGTYTLCRGCRRVVADHERTAKGYEEGVSCRQCVGGLDPLRRDALRERHRQVLLAEARGERHIARRAQATGPGGAVKLTPEQALRDLVWAVESPSFVDGPNTDCDGAGDMIDPATVDADALVAFLGPRSSHRVGRYFESLLAFWLERVRRVDMVGSALPVRDGNRTVGEIDFLFRDEQGRLTHWEVAIKFFLHHPDRAGSHFPGPNATDDFERKADKLFGQQLELASAHYPDVSARRGFVKGRAFYHPLVGEPTVSPERMAPTHLRGSWMRSDELHLLETWGDARFRVTEKPFWLAPVDQVPLLSVDELGGVLQRHFATSHRPLMIDVDHGGCDANCERLCVVGETWDTLPAIPRRKPPETF